MGAFTAGNDEGGERQGAFSGSGRFRLRGRRLLGQNLRDLEIYRLRVFRFFTCGTPGPKLRHVSPFWNDDLQLFVLAMVLEISVESNA